MPDPNLLIITSTSGFSLQTSVLSSGISWSKSANFDKTEIINRSGEILTYRNSSLIPLTIELDFFAIDESNFNAEDVSNILLGLQSLTYPVTPGVNPPPICYITYGTGLIFKRWPCVCASVSSAAGIHNMYDPTGDPMTAKVSVQFLELQLKAVSSNDAGGAGISSFSNLTF